MIVYYALLVVITFERLAELVVSQRHATEQPASRRRGIWPGTLSRHGGAAHGAAGRLLGRAPGPAPRIHPGAGLADARLGRGRERAALVVHRHPGPAVDRAGDRHARRCPWSGPAPYRWFAHPNYVAVIVEGAALPLVGSAWITACTFTVLNAALLTVRLRCETRALAAAAP